MAGNEFKYTFITNDDVESEEVQADKLVEKWSFNLLRIGTCSKVTN
jgi:hypothetical protein